jgi:hypothetical protein
MGFWEFIKPTFSKIFVPALFVVYLIIVFVMTQGVMQDLGEKSCEMKEIFDEVAELQAQRDIAGLQELVNESAEVVEEIQEDLENDKYKLGFVFGSNLATSKINPFYPVPCPLTESEFCGSYAEEEHYECVNFLVENDGLEGFVEINNLEYRELSYISLVSNLVLIFLILYLIICLEKWVFRLIWPKKEKDEL